MTKRKAGSIPLSYGHIIILALFASLAGWGGLILYTYAFPPDLSTYPLFFFLLFISATATIVPLTVLVNARLAKNPSRPSHWRPLRQAIWGGLWVTLCAWLQLIRLLDWIAAALFLVIFVTIEWFILSRK